MVGGDLLEERSRAVLASDSDQRDNEGGEAGNPEEALQHPWRVEQPIGNPKCTPDLEDLEAGLSRGVADVVRRHHPDLGVVFGTNERSDDDSEVKQPHDYLKPGVEDLGVSEDREGPHDDAGEGTPFVPPPRQVLYHVFREVVGRQQFRRHRHGGGVPVFEEHQTLGSRRIRVPE